MIPKRDSLHGRCPTLAPLFGGADKKPRPLDKDVVAVGRARGCDITLDANEVSAIHCIFYRAGQSFRIRDCGSRTGIRVNGNPAKNAPLADGDVLQIGPFSFELKLPAELSGLRTIDPVLFLRAQNSRQRLVRLALQLRRKLRQGPDSTGALNDKVADLKAKIRSYDQKLSQLETAEMELDQERGQLAKEHEAERHHVQQVEAEMSQRLQDVEREIKEKWAEFQHRCVAEERHSQVVAGTSSGAVLSADLQEQLEKQRLELVEREQKLKQQEDAWAAKERQILKDYEVVERERQGVIQLKSSWEAEQTGQHDEVDKKKAAGAQAEAALHQQKNELTRMLGDVKRIQEELRTQPRVDYKALQQENQQLRLTVGELEKRLADAADAQQLEQLLAEQKQAKQTLTDEVQALREQLRQGKQVQATQVAPAELVALRSENEDLRQLLHKHVLKPSQTSTIDEELRAENQQLRQILTEYEERSAQEAGGETGSVAAEQLRGENELLRQLLQEKDKFLEEIRAVGPGAPGELPLGVREQLESQEQDLERLRAETAQLTKQLEEERSSQQPAHGSPSLDDVDLDSAEAELNRAHRQLEAERAKLNKEIESLRSRNAELDEATRELEMEMSRERAELAHERTRLDRLRDEIKNEMERSQRDGGVRESLASVQRLREQMKTAGSRR